jgi:hypothetical protein
MSALPVVVTVSNASGLTTTGNATINVTDVAPVSLFTTQTPTQPNQNDGAGTVGDYELGMRFSSSSPGQITGIRYWKPASETGTHTGRIWSSSGALLASVVFTGETASGWQTKALAAPINVTAGTQYVVSVNVNVRYGVTEQGFAAAASNGPLTAPVGAGVYNYIPGSFPAASFSNSNYFRDVVFVPGAAPPLTVPVVTNGSFSLNVPASAGQVVGTMTATQSPTAWAIMAGNTAGYFSISNAGVITTTAAVVAGSYSLTVSATNAAGSGSGTASIVAAVVGARPGPTNTGHVNAPGYTGSLTAFSGTIQSNTTYTFRSFNGAAVGSAASPVANVTFYGCRFRATGDLNVALFGDNITFDYCTFEPTSVTSPPVSYSQGYQYGIVAGGPYNSFAQKLTVQNCNIWGFGNAIDVTGSTQAKPQVFRNNWIHDPRADGGIDHTDGLGSYSGGGTSRYVVIDNNVIEGVGNTNALGFQAGTWSNFTITNNLFGGFGYTMSIYANVSNLTFTDNVFSTRYPVNFGPMREGWGSYPGTVWRRNKWHHPAGAAWGNAAHDGRYWMPVSGSSQNSATFTSATDYTG